MGFEESEATQSPHQVKHIKGKTLAWLGYIIRINQAGVAEKVSESKVE
jgi:hypothetical protein